MLGRDHRIRHNNEFLHVLRKGKRHYFGGVLLYWTDNALPITRIGFIVGKKFSPSAVKRNRQKRILRHAARDLLPHIMPGKDIVISYTNDGKMISHTNARSIIEKTLITHNLLVK
jgi:ribonuclease P protein component